MNHEYRTQLAFESFIDYCREQERFFRDGDVKISGVEHLLEALKKGIITLENYIDVLPAIINPYTKYELIPTKKATS